MARGIATHLVLVWLIQIFTLFPSHYFATGAPLSLGLESLHRCAFHLVHEGHHNASLLTDILTGAEGVAWTLLYIEKWLVKTPEQTDQEFLKRRTVPFRAGRESSVCNVHLLLRIQPTQINSRVADRYYPDKMEIKKGPTVYYILLFEQGAPVEWDQALIQFHNFNIYVIEIGGAAQYLCGTCGEGQQLKEIPPGESLDGRYVVQMVTRLARDMHGKKVRPVHSTVIEGLEKACPQEYFHRVKGDEALFCSPSRKSAFLLTQVVNATAVVVPRSSPNVGMLPTFMHTTSNVLFGVFYAHDRRIKDTLVRTLVLEESWPVGVLYCRSGEESMSRNHYGRSGSMSAVDWRAWVLLVGASLGGLAVGGASMGEGRLEWRFRPKGVLLAASLVSLFAAFHRSSTVSSVIIAPSHPPDNITLAQLVGDFEHQIMYYTPGKARSDLYEIVYRAKFRELGALPWLHLAFYRAQSFTEYRERVLPLRRAVLLDLKPHLAQAQLRAYREANQGRKCGTLAAPLKEMELGWKVFRGISADHLGQILAQLLEAGLSRAWEEMERFQLDEETEGFRRAAVAVEAAEPGEEERHGNVSVDAGSLWVVFSLWGLSIVGASLVLCVECVTWESEKRV